MRSGINQIYGTDMAQRILIDMIRLREVLVNDPDISLPEALYYPAANTNGLKTVRELAGFLFTCRKCDDAPCIAACPAEALEKDSEGIINRHTNLCISCKSCVTICPFGTMMTDFFKHHRNKDLYYNLTNLDEMEKFARACPEGTVTITDQREAHDENIFKLNDRVLIKDHIYNKE
jgi:Fe-S-cluster-containing hydrogenase component 2